ncbi:hypothetical protein PQX77_000843 [Marasmius sp. AFHP31]|nr:hypothetical protein PQX77_000843 [Marasmius sp. AFHP31]
MATTTNKKQDAISQKYNAVVPSSISVTKKISNYKGTYVPITVNEHIRRKHNRERRAAEVKATIAAIRRHIRDRCMELGTKYKRKPKYFLDMVYQGGVRLTKPANNPNHFNSFKAVKAYDRRQAGEPPMSILDIQKVYRPEYNALDKQGLSDLLARHKEIQDEDKRERIKRPSIKEKTADVAAALSQVAGIFQGLKTRVGIEVTALVVKNCPEDFMTPKWIVTDKRVMEYLGLIQRGFDPVHIGQKVEAFAVAGCDVAKVCKTQKEYAELLKKQITRLVQDGLDEACKGQNVTMQYERFDKLITARYGVVVEGWPTTLEFQKPGGFSGDTNKLLVLHEAWKSGTTHFRKLSPEELTAWQSTRAQGLQDGTIQEKERQQRSDAGKSKKKKAVAQVEEDEGGESEGNESVGAASEEEEVPSTSAKVSSRVRVAMIRADLTKASGPKKPSKASLSQLRNASVNEDASRKTSRSKVTGKPRSNKTKAPKPRESSKRKETAVGHDGTESPGPSHHDFAAPDTATPSSTTETHPRPKPVRKVPTTVALVQGTEEGVEATNLGNGGTESRVGDGSEPGKDGPIVDGAEILPSSPTLAPVSTPPTVASKNDTSAAVSQGNSLNSVPFVECVDSVIDPILLERSSTLDASPTSTSHPIPQPSETSTSTSTISEPNSSIQAKRKRDRGSSSDAGIDEAGEGQAGQQVRSKRKRIAVVRRHLGASSHPASKHFGLDETDGGLNTDLC